MNNRDDGAAFFGKVAATTTHELQNVLAIIKENAGLMEDFIQMNPDNLQDLSDKLTKCLGKIKEQAYRGVDLTSGFNAFAHTTDRLCAPVNIYEMAKRLIFLTKRVFLQKGVQILLTSCDAPPSIETDPVLFQKLLWNCFECLMEAMTEKTNVQVQILNSDAGKGIQLFYADPAPGNGDFSQKLTVSAKWKNIQTACKEMNLVASPLAPELMGIRILLNRS